MIVRPTGARLLLITQPDHAALAARIMAAWRADGFVDRPTRAVVLEAVRQHDIGWTPEDAAPRLDPSTAAPYDFISAPGDVRRRIWPRAIRRLAPGSAYVAALVAQHARTVHRRHAGDAAWQPFLARMARERDRLLGLAAEARHHTFDADYAIVAIGDLLSLIFCNGWREPHVMDGYRAERHGDRIVVRPDPFAGRTVPIAVEARALARTAYATAAALVAAYRDAPVVTLTGRLSGAGA